MGTLADLTEQGAKELVTKIHAVWGVTPEGEETGLGSPPKYGKKDRMIEVGLIQGDKQQC